MDMLIGLAITLVVMFGAGIAVEFHKGLKEDRKFIK